jgi:peroxiredoxin
LAWFGGSKSKVDATLSSPGSYQEPATGLGDQDNTGKPLPDLVLTRLDGTTTRLSDYRGAPLVVNMWYSTCAPCVREMPAFQKVYTQIGNRVHFVGVNIFDQPDQAKQFVAKTGVQYDILRDPQAILRQKLGIANAPATLFVTANGQIVKQKVGALDEQQLTTLINQLFPA